MVKLDEKKIKSITIWDGVVRYNEREHRPQTEMGEQIEVPSRSAVWVSGRRTPPALLYYGQIELSSTWRATERSGEKGGAAGEQGEAAIRRRDVTRLLC